jgi:hypothetical protein
VARSAGRLTESERRRMLKVVDRMMRQPATRPQREVGDELRGIRTARRHGGRQHPAR